MTSGRPRAPSAAARPDLTAAVALRRRRASLRSPAHSSTVAAGVVSAPSASQRPRRLSALGVSARWGWAGEAALDELAYALVQGRRHRLLALGGDRAGGAGGGEHFLLGG